MKKNLLFLPLFLFSCSQFQSKQQKAESLIKNYLDSSLNDPKSYESMKFDTIKPMYKQYGVGDPEGRRLDNIISSYLDSAIKYKEKAGYALADDGLANYEKCIKLEKFYEAKADSVSAISEAKGKGYKGAVFAYDVVHSFRAKNALGALIVQKMRFQTDSAITKVINAGNME